MAFVLTPVYQTPQYSPFGFCSPVARPAHHYRRACQPRRVQFSPFSNFFSEVDDLLSEIDRQAHHEAQRKAQAERRERKRALRAKFVVNQSDEGWKVDGELQGFDQENLTIDVTSGYTVTIAGNTEWRSDQASSHKALDSASTPDAEKTSDIEVEQDTKRDATTPTLAADSDTESHKSYQPTVEEDFEDLGAEAASLISASSASSTTSVHEEKGKDEAVTNSTNIQQSSEEQAQGEKPQEQDRVHGSFERTFKFPERIDTANVRASFKDGLLSIVVPRAPAPETKRIAIQ